MTTHSLASKGWLYDDAPVTPLPSLQRERRMDRLPLSLNERTAWIATQENAGNVYLNMKTLLMISGVIDETILRQAINNFIQAHEILRTTYQQDAEEKLYRQIHDSLVISIELHDLRSLADKLHDQHLREIIKNSEQKLFSLAHLPLFEFNLVQLADDHFALIFCMHHIIGDGFSVGLLLREILQTYQLLLSGQTPAITSSSLSYTDYAIWQHHIVQEGLWNPLINYWENKMAAAQDLQLPYHTAKKPFHSNAAEIETLTLDSNKLNQLNLFAAANKISVYVIFMGALQLLLRDLTGQSLLLIETILGNRNTMERMSLIGSLATDGVALYQIEETRQVNDFLTRILRQTLEINKLQQDCGLLIYNAISRRFPTMPTIGINFHSQYLKPFPGMAIVVDDSYFSKNTLPGNLDLFLEVWPQNQQIKIDFVYKTCLFNNKMIKDFAARYLNIISFMLQNPHARLCEYCP